MKYLDKLKPYLDSKLRLPDDFSDRSRVYLNTTENIRQYVSNLDVRGKRILTVAASGDQAFSLIANGASEIICFDSNEMTFPNLELKRAIIYTHELPEVKDFYDKTSPRFLDKGMYSDARELLSPEARELYDYTFGKMTPNRIFNKLYMKYVKTQDELRGLVTYYDPEKFEILKERLRLVPISFIHCDISMLPNHIPGKVDGMMFSNISDYTVVDRASLNEYRRLINTLRNNHLNDYGFIECIYLYEYDRKEKRRTDPFLKDKDNRQLFFKGNHQDTFITTTLEGYDEGTKDAAITLIKVR